mmetsp:Transcript_20110/g.55989  ORF Transcript_20110/g.55989 Transcript_20110/m.55989 type:complete len:575 (-) Transcript_20110:259-1983(-)|eukprot:CAMPEP_0202350892 /NCGR_PEP_ID=MMETSP1126-20121109/7774_1 /ASSEMBLY_ACC=CAM_ASM_000457 /TAXON_ID=3047 /ORGANISM="Dunaliella tertiolecta, Strain CCMP1320" /LENGTH=574 /DNA_ID=CAMNT_0048942937 /DNA_START=96 /DNA_END=1820 /DNA_ORIENTATION=+
MAKRVLNVNVGVLGHVDSGKTSLVGALSTSLSTAALDKHPQSKERGITLDLGFSSFTVPLPEHLAHLPYDELQFTMVDCPGHASLIRTIIGGVQIIDMMILVVDVTKGLQTQTAECMVVGEIATSNLIVALNKCDMLPEDNRPKAVKKAQKRLAQTFDMTKFAGATMVPMTARQGAEDPGVQQLKEALIQMVPADMRVAAPDKPFLFAVDHCFPFKGQGTVMTGTVLQGTVSVGESIELPSLKLSKPVRSMQMFKRPMNKIAQGDRAGICVTQLDPDLVERGVVCAPGSVPTFTGAIAAVEKIRFYSGQVLSKAKFHVSVGHATVMATPIFFGLPDGEGVAQDAALAMMMENLSSMASRNPTPMHFDAAHEYVYQEELYGLEGRPLGASPSLKQTQGDGVEAYSLSEPDCPCHYGRQWAYLQFEHPVTAPKDSLVIAAKFDGDVHGEMCRLAFYGRILCIVDPSKPQDLQQMKVFKLKEKKGSIERIMPDGQTAIVRGMFKKETDPSIYTNLKVTTADGSEEGIIESTFGKSGKQKVFFPNGLLVAPQGGSGDKTVVLRCKRYIFDQNRKRLKQ